MATSSSGPAPVCARPPCGSMHCRPCKNGRPQACVNPYRPGKTRRDKRGK